MLKSDEFKLQGKWITSNDKVIDDEISIRIKFLKNNYLIKLATSYDGWDTLFQDSNDKRFWELIFEKSELHGGGPPSLIVISKVDIEKKYNLKV